MAQGTTLSDDFAHCCVELVVLVFAHVVHGCVQLDFVSAHNHASYMRKQERTHNST